MSSPAMLKLLNDQITSELSASHQYLALSCELGVMGLNNMATFFRKQSEEEREHAMKFVTFVMDIGGHVVLGGLESPKAGYKHPKEIVQAALEGELYITQLIHDLMSLAQRESDYPAQSFLTWFVDEQVEEVASMRDLLQLIEMSGGNLLQADYLVKDRMPS